MNGLISPNASCFYPDKLPCYRHMKREYAAIQVNNVNFAIVETLQVNNQNFAIVKKGIQSNT